jgi:hypothetical protein
MTASVASKSSSSWQDGCRLVLLGELKDFDLVLHRISSEPVLRKYIASTERQLDRKASTVRRKWRTLVPMVTGRPLGDEQAFLAKAVVASAYLPPHLAERYPLLTFSEIESFLGDAWRWPLDFPPRFKTAIEALV